MIYITIINIVANLISEIRYTIDIKGLRGEQMKKYFISISVILYFLFIIETLTGYWIWKPREVGKIFNHLVERGDSYILHVNILPLILLFFFFVHTYLGLKKYLRKNKLLEMLLLLFNAGLFIFFIYLHLI